MNRIEFGKDGCEVDAIEFDDLPEHVQRAIMAGVEDYERGDFVDFDIEDE